MFTKGITTNPPSVKRLFIVGARTSVDKIDLFVSGWGDPRHDLSSHIGTERIEDGSTITDHVVAMPTKLSLIGYVSDMSLGPDAPGEAWEKIRELVKKETILKVITEWGVYEEMVIKSADTTQIGRGMEFNLYLQEIVRVGVSRSEIIEQDSIIEPSKEPNPASERNAKIDGGTKPLVPDLVPVTPLGNDQFATGTPGSPDRKVISPLRDNNGSLVLDENGRPKYYFVRPFIE